MKRLSELIKKYRADKGLSQGEFGSLFGISAQAVSKWERGICLPDVLLLPRIAEVIGCSLDELFE